MEMIKKVGEPKNGGSLPLTLFQNSSVYLSPAILITSLTESLAQATTFLILFATWKFGSGLNRVGNTSHLVWSEIGCHTPTPEFFRSAT